MIAEQERNTWEPLDLKVLDTLREIESAEEDMADLAAQMAALEIQLSELSIRLFRELAEAKGAYDAWITAVNQQKPPVESEAKEDRPPIVAEKLANPAEADRVRRRPPSAREDRS